MADEFPPVAVGILATSTYEEIAETYNRVCLDNFKLRTRLHELKTVNDRVIEEEKQYHTIKAGLESQIFKYKKKIINNHSIYIRALELFQQQLRKISALKRNKNSLCVACGNPHSALPELIAANSAHARQLEKQLEQFYCKIKDSAPSSSSATESSFLGQNAEDDYYDADFHEDPPLALSHPRHPSSTAGVDTSNSKSSTAANWPIDFNLSSFLMEYDAVKAYAASAKKQMPILRHQLDAMKDEYREQIGFLAARNGALERQAEGSSTRVVALHEEQDAHRRCSNLEDSVKCYRNVLNNRAEASGTAAGGGTGFSSELRRSMLVETAGDAQEPFPPVHQPAATAESPSLVALSVDHSRAGRGTAGGERVERPVIKRAHTSACLGTNAVHGRREASPLKDEGTGKSSDNMIYSAIMETDPIDMPQSAVSCEGEGGNTQDDGAKSVFVELRHESLTNSEGGSGSVGGGVNGPDNGAGACFEDEIESEAGSGVGSKKNNCNETLGEIMRLYTGSSRAALELGAAVARGRNVSPGSPGSNKGQKTRGGSRPSSAGTLGERSHCNAQSRLHALKRREEGAGNHTFHIALASKGKPGADETPTFTPKITDMGSKAQACFSPPKTTRYHTPHSKVSHNRKLKMAVRESINNNSFSTIFVPSNSSLR